MEQLRGHRHHRDDDDVDVVVPSQWPCAQVVVEDLGQILLEGFLFFIGIHGKRSQNILPSYRFLPTPQINVIPGTRIVCVTNLHQTIYGIPNVIEPPLVNDELSIQVK